MSDARGDLSGLGARRLTLIAETAYRREKYKLLHAITRSGLLLGTGTSAQFLLFRGRSLPPGCWGHRAVLFRAAASLARRQGEQKTADSATSEARRALQRSGMPAGQLERLLTKVILEVTDETIHRLIESEMDAQTYPSGPYYDFLNKRYRDEWIGDDLCDCPRCRAERGEYVDPWEFEEDDFFDDEFDDDFESDLPSGSAAEELKSIFGLNANSSKDDFAQVAKLFAKEFGPLPPGFQKGILPMILEMLAKQGKGGIPDFGGDFLPFLNELPRPKARRRRR